MNRFTEETGMEAAGGAAEFFDGGGCAGEGANRYLPLCPYIGHPFPACYCSVVTGTTVRLALMFCGSNYDRCLIYRRSCDRNLPPHPQPTALR